MVIKDKYLTPHFRVSEMRCRCRRPDCDAVPMDIPHMHLLESLRLLWEKPLIVTSGTRCPFWNKLQGGAPNSQHVYGKATDLWLETEDIEKLAVIAEKLGFGGIGRGRLHLLHVDTGPSGRKWSYQDR